MVDVEENERISQVEIRESVLNDQVIDLYRDFLRKEQAEEADEKKRLGKDNLFYQKRADHNSALLSGLKVMKYIKTMSDEGEENSIVHTAWEEGTLVGIEVTGLDQLRVRGEFIGVTYDHAGSKTALRLLEARHQKLKELGINEYEALMLNRTARVLKRLGVDIEAVPEEHLDSIEVFGGSPYLIRI